MKHLEVVVVLLVVGSALLYYSFFSQNAAVGLATKNGIEIAVNGNTGQGKINFVATAYRPDEVVSFYELDTEGSDNIDVKYQKQTGSSSELYFYSFPGSENSFSFSQKQKVSEKIDPDLFDNIFLVSEDYVSGGKVSVIISLAIYPGISFDVVRNSFVNDISSFLDLSYYRVEDISFINSVSMEIEPKYLDSIASLSMVKRIELNRKVFAVLDKSLPIIKAQEVWGLNDSQGRPVTGMNVTIAIIDTGVDYTHPDLGGCFGSQCKVVGGWDFFNGDADPMDDHGHGTHVAATAAGDGALKGVATGAKIYAYKSLSSSGSGSWLQVINAIKRATDPNSDGNTSDHVDIISMSLGGGGDESSSISKAVDEAVDAGVVVVSAAGNSGTASGALGVPAAARKGIAVAATDDNDKLAYFSSRGPTGLNNLKPDVSAPGVGICAAQWDSAWDYAKCLDNKHTSISGTSMATPHVSGVAALLLQQHPDWEPSDVKSALMSTSKDLGLKVLEQGSGRVDSLEATKASITTSPASISFGQVFEKSFSASLEVKNNGPEKEEVSITVGDAISETGEKYPAIVSVEKSKLNLKAGEKDTIQVTASLPEGLDGEFYGYITLSSAGTSYRVPYYFIKKSRIYVEVVNGSKALSPSIIAIRSHDLSVMEQVARLWDFSGNKHSFTLKAGNYTIYSIGDYSDRNMKYILSKDIVVGSSEERTEKLDIAEAESHQILTESFGGEPLYVKQISYGIRDSLGSKTLSMSSGSSDIPSTGDGKFQTLYISKDPKDLVKKEILISFMGYPKRPDVPGISTITRGSETAGGIDSMYLLYWLFERPGIPQNLTFTRDEMGEYKYIHNLPGGDPNQGSSDFGSNYKTTDRWISKYLAPTVNFYEKPALPRERTVYIKAGNYSYKHIPYINYIHFTGRFDEIAATDAQYEIDKNANQYYYTGVTAKPGEKRTVYHGTTPLIPTHFKNSQNFMSLDPLLQTKGKESYIYKISKINYVTSSGSNAVYTLQPRMLVYKDNALLYNLTPSWDDYTLSSYDYTNPRYRVEIDIPSFYEIQARNKVTAEFTLRSTDVNPPYLDSMDISPYFEKGKPLSIILTVKDDIKANKDIIVSAYYREGSDWKQVSLIREGSIYVGSVVPETSSIDLKVSASDGENTIEYVMEPVSKEGIDIDLGFTTASTRVNKGSVISFTGKAKESVSKEPISQALVKYFLSGSFFDFSRTDLTSYNAGSFLAKWITNVSYDGIYDEFVASYPGTGLYKPREETMKISFNVPGPDLLDILVNGTTIYSKWDAASNVVFKSDYEGVWKEYQTQQSVGSFYYTVPEWVNRSLKWKFEAQDSLGVWNTGMRERVLDLSLPEQPSQNITEPPKNVTQPPENITEPEPQLNITTISLVDFDNNKGWGEKWNFVCSASNTNGNTLLVKLLSRLSGSEWETKSIQPISDTKEAKNVSFQTSFTWTGDGTHSIKCQAVDGASMNETLEQQIVVEKDDVSLLVGKDKSVVKRGGKDTVALTLIVTDIDLNANVTPNTATIKVTKDGNMPYDVEYGCKVEGDKCIVSVDPDGSFSVGNQSFEGFFNDSKYKVAASSNGSFIVTGSLEAKLKGGKSVKEGEEISLEVEVNDDAKKKADPDSLGIFYRPWLSFGTWVPCEESKTGSGEYSCTINTKGMLLGAYDVRVSATKQGHDPFVSVYNEVFHVRETVSKKYRFNITDRKSEFRIPELNSSFKFRFKDDIEPPEINFTFDSINPVPKNFTGFAPLDKYLRIEPPAGLNENLTEVEIRIDYTDAEVSAKNFDEESLRISFYNISSGEWEELVSGVNTTGNYVWANVTHLSDFGVGGKLDDGSSCSSGDQCSSGNCASDFDGSGSWCASAGNCASESLVNYFSGSTTCYGDNQQTCSSGSWSETVCLNGCSAGLCVVSTPPPSTPSSSGSSGGGGGSLGSSTPIRDCTENDYTCSEWSECENSKQQRLCSRKTGVVCSGGIKPVESQVCGQVSGDKEPEGETIETLLDNVVVETMKTPQVDEKSRKLISITAAIMILMAFFIVLWQKID